MFTNEAYHQWFGLSSAELRGKRIWEVMGDAAFNTIRRSRSGRSPARGSPSALIPFKGREARWVSASYSPDLDPDGEVAGIFVLADDVTARKKIEEGTAFLSEATGLLLSSLDYETTLANLAHLAVPRVADWCAVCFEKDGRIRPMVIVHRIRPGSSR